MTRSREKGSLPRGARGRQDDDDAKKFNKCTRAARNVAAPSPSSSDPPPPLATYLFPLSSSFATASRTPSPPSLAMVASSLSMSVM